MNAPIPLLTNPPRTLRHAIAAVLAACTLAAAQTPTLLRDVNQTPVLPRDSYPFHGFALGGWYYFTADSPAAGRELYRTDGSPANTTLIELEPGLAGSRFQGDFYPGLTRTYFFRDDGTHGTELWRTDGTVAGTTLVKDLEPGQASKNFSASVAHVLGDLFLFTTLDEGRPVTRLWASDGTAAGTVELVPPTGVIPRVPMVRFGARVVLLWSTPTSGNELWVTDGTPSGTAMLVDVNPGVAGSDPWEIKAIGNQLIFSARDAARGREVWITDGTQAGTRAIDVVPGPAGSEPRDFVALGSEVLFRAFTPTFGTELWRTDGTQSGTVLVADIRTGASASSYPELFGVLNNGVVFAADDGVHGTEMWVSDGTAAGTRMLADLAPGATSSYAGGELTDMVQWVGNALYFISFDAISVTDGTSPGTRTIKRFVNPMSLRTLLLGALPNGSCLFRADDGLAGIEPWVTDGVGAGLFLNLNPEPAGATDGSFLFPCAPPLLALNDGVHGSELWRTDATSVGTMLLRDIKAGVEGANVECTGAYLGDRTLVAADDGVNGREFWITDGVNGAQLLRDIQPGSGSGIQNAAVTPFRDRLLFAADDGVLGQEPWVTDGTSAGTALLRDIAPFGSGYVVMQRMGEQVFITSYLINSSSLWRTDGSSSGTVRIPMPVSPQGRLVNYRGRFYFAGATSSAGTELWSSDGTTAGTSLVADIVPGSGSSHPQLRGVANDLLWFAACTPATGCELWVTDGTASGTRLVMDYNPGPPDSGQDGWMTLGDKALFAAYTPASGHEIYVITPGNGPTLLKDIWPGPQSSKWYSFAGFASSRYLWFTAADPVGGYELWRTDGTSGGTVPVTDLSPGPSSSYAAVIGPVGGSLVLRADDGVTGVEPWILNPGAMTYTRGHPCGLGLHEPALAVDDPVLGGPMAIKVSDVASSSPGVLLFGFPGPAAPLGNGCSLYLSSPSVFTLFTTDATGSWSMGFTLPNVPALTGVLAAFQAAVAATPVITGLESTAASILVFGQ